MAYFPQTSEPRGSDSNKPPPNSGPNIQPSHFNPFLQNSHVPNNPFLPFSQVPNIPSSHSPTFPYYTNHTSPVVPQPGTQYAPYSLQSSPLNPYNGFHTVPVPVPVPGPVPVPVPVPVPGLVPRELNPRISEYSFHHNTIPQENSHENSHSSSGSWSSGFTRILQDLTLDRSEARTPSHHTQENKVSQFDFQRIIASTKDIVQAAYFSLNTFFDISQIRTFENFYIGLENQISMLIPHISRQTDEFNIQNLVQAMRNLQSQIEDKIINFYKNLSDREKIKVVFTLPHLQNRSFVQAVISPARHLSGLSANQSVNNSVHK